MGLFGGTLRHLKLGVTSRKCHGEGPQNDKAPGVGEEIGQESS